jgi:hypothetical protein
MLTNLNPNPNLDQALGPQFKPRLLPTVLTGSDSRIKIMIWQNITLLVGALSMPVQ